MIYTIGRLIEDFRVIAGEASSDFWGSKAKQIVEEALTIFLSARWPFNEGEKAVTTIAPYTTGTVAVVNGSATVTGTGTSWSTSWPVPAIIRINGSTGDSIVVQSIESTTSLTLDIEWPYDSDATATYSLEFPAHYIDNWISVTGVVEGRLAANRTLTQAPFERMLASRPWMPHTFWPYEYGIIPSDGASQQKLYVWPPPADVRTIRYRYVKAVPAFRVYGAGTASATNGNTALTGVDTLWAKQGYSLAGQYFEFRDQPGHQIQIASVTNDTAAVLVAGGYTGVTDSGEYYWISQAINCPDDLKPLLRSICRWKYLQDAAPALAPEAERRYRQLLNQAISRSEIGRDASAVLPIRTGDVNWGAPPDTPAILRVED